MWASLGVKEQKACLFVALLWVTKAGEGGGLNGAGLWEQQFKPKYKQHPLLRINTSKRNTPFLQRKRTAAGRMRDDTEGDNKKVMVAHLLYYLFIFTLAINFWTTYPCYMMLDELAYVPSSANTDKREQTAALTKDHLCITCEPENRISQMTTLSLKHFVSIRSFLVHCPKIANVFCQTKQERARKHALHSSTSSQWKTTMVYFRCPGDF